MALWKRLRHPSGMVRTTRPSQGGAADIDAVQQCRPRRVTCYLPWILGPVPSPPETGNAAVGGRGGDLETRRAPESPTLSPNRHRLRHHHARSADRRESEVARTGAGGKALDLITCATFRRCNLRHSCAFGRLCGVVNGRAARCPLLQEDWLPDGGHVARTHSGVAHTASLMDLGAGADIPISLISP